MDRKKSEQDMEQRRMEEGDNMFTVNISINGNAVITRSCWNMSPKAGNDKVNTYRVDDGNYVNHIPNDGPVALAKKLLNLVKEK